MKRLGLLLLAGAVLGGWAGGPAVAEAQAPQTVTKVFAAPYERMWTVVESVLKSLGWSIDERDKTTGFILTDSRGLDFKDFGVYGDGTRHKLRIFLKAQTESWTAVSVERELYKEERILWMKERKPLQAPDKSVEFSVLEAIEKTTPSVGAAPAPVGPPPGAPSGPGPQTAVARPGARGEFTVKVTYRVKGTAGAANLTYRNPEGGTVQTSVRLPWEVSFDAKGGTFLSVSAQNQGVSGSVTCEILLDGDSRTTSTSNGAYVIAECSNSAERN
jgi:Mycobacterium membrane protein